MFIFILVLSFIGFLDAVFLTVKHYTGAPIPCSLLDGCDVVTHSKYSTVRGVPISLLGAGYYLIIFLTSFLGMQGSRGAASILKLFTIIGLLVSTVLVYLQVFSIKQLCLYCLVSAAISTIIFICSRFIKKMAPTLQSGPNTKDICSQ